MLYSTNNWKHRLKKLKSVSRSNRKLSTCRLSTKGILYDLVESHKDKLSWRRPVRMRSGVAMNGGLSTMPCVVNFVLFSHLRCGQRKNKLSSMIVIAR